MAESHLSRESQRSRGTTATSRRRFLQWAGVTFVVTAAGCGKKNGPTGPGGDTTFPNNDQGALNYLYVLEQLAAAFYIRAVDNAWSGRTSEETQIMTDIRDHEVQHREFYRSLLGNSGVGDFEFSFNSVNFADRNSTLSTARLIEDLTVSAYNGSGRLFSNPGNMTVVQKVASVEGRHAAAIRDLLSPKSAAFAGDDVVQAQYGLEVYRWPSEVLPIIDPFVTTSFTSSLP